MSFPYKTILVLGATSGIGNALAEVFVSQGKHVLVTGRRKEKLDDFVSKHGKDKATAIVFDNTKLGEIKSFAAKVIKDHPDLDCVFLNSGMQRGFNFSQPDSIDLSQAEEEILTNYTSYLHLVVAFLPHLQKQQKPTSLIFTSSGLALVPLLRAPNYSATKAALHHFILCLREQLKDGPGNVKVIEIFPPAVQTELHDEKHQPDIKNGRSFGMPLDEFTDEAWAGLSKGEEQVPVGFDKAYFEAFENTRQEKFHQFVQSTKKSQ